MKNAPSTDIDIFTDEAIANPYPVYKKIRDIGPAVWSSVHDVWMISRYQDVRSALRADSILISGKGVTLNSIFNNNPRVSPTTLASDGELHMKRRSVVTKPMTPRPLKEIRSVVQATADQLVDKVLSKSSFEAMEEFAQPLPVSIVSSLVGLPEEGREQMLDWAAAAFNAIGPDNERSKSSMPSLLDLRNYSENVRREDLDPDGWAAQVYIAADEGKIEKDEVRGLIFDYMTPSLDTTIIAVGHMVYQLGKNPAEFEKLKADHSLISATVNETLRIGSPLRAFSRFAEEEYRNDQVFIPSGSRVAVLYGSANHDERHYPDPEKFDISRNPRDHLATGFGVHRCAGGHLAQLEMECLLSSILQKVSSIKVETPKPMMSNLISGFSSLEASFEQ